MTEITALGATELATRIAAGELSSAEVIEAHIERQLATHDWINAVVVRRYDEARSEAREADRRRSSGEPIGPLHGVPVSIKECLDVIGTPSTSGLTNRSDHRATSDETHVARLREAGAIVLAKTNVAQLLAYFESDNPMYGRTDNPWDATRTAGGSSGGEGALIAVGGSPLGLGTDIGGSSRIPAAFCGVVGFKPTTGRLPDTVQLSFDPEQQLVRSVVGVLAREVSDVGLGLEIANGGRAADAASGHSLGHWREVDVSSLRVVVYTDDGTFVPAPAARRAVTEAAAALRAAGATVDEWSPPAVGRAVGLGLAAIGGDRLASFRRLLKGSQVDPRIAALIGLARLPRRLHPVLRAVLAAVGQEGLAGGLKLFDFGSSGPDRARLVRDLADYQRRFAVSLDGADLILSPGSPLPAFRHGASKELATMGGATFLYNVLGYPAGIVPWTRVNVGEEVGRAKSRELVARRAFEAETGSAGLPIGVQVAALPWRDHEAIAAMAVLEAASRRLGQHPGMPVR